MKQATLKAAGAAALGIAIAAMGAGSASAAPANGPLDTLTSGGLTGTLGHATDAVPANPVTTAVDGVSHSLAPAADDTADAPAPATEHGSASHDARGLGGTGAGKGALGGLGGGLGGLLPGGGLGGLGGLH